MKKVIGLFFILSLCLFTLVGCSKDEPASLQDKNIQELEYIEGKAVSILNKMVREEYTKKEDKDIDKDITDANEVLDEEIGLLVQEDTLDWEKLLEDTKKIESSIPTILVDLAALNIQAEDIAKLSNGVNNMIIAIDNKDERTYLIELNNVYSLIPTYMEKYAGDKEITFKKRLKYYAIATYISYMDGNLEMARTQVEELDKAYNDKMQDINYAQNNEYNLNKLYILIQELKRAVEADSRELVRSKYLLLIEEI